MLISLNEYVTDSQMNELVYKHTTPEPSGERTYMRTDWDGVCDDMGQYGLDVSVLVDYTERLVEALS